MSQKSQNEPTVPSITSMPDPEHAETLVEKKPNFAKRVASKIKNTPPKTALAVVGGVALVTAGAVLGRKTAPLHVAIVDSEFDVEPILETPSSYETDDTVA